MLFTALGVIATVRIIEKKRNPIYTDLIQLLNVDSLFYHKGGYLTAWDAFEILVIIMLVARLNGKVIDVETAFLCGELQERICDNQSTYQLW